MAIDFFNDIFNDSISQITCIYYYIRLVFWGWYYDEKKVWFIGTEDIKLN